MSVQMASQGKMPVVLLKDGSTETKGRDAHKNNIAASKIIAEIVRTSLGPLEEWTRCWWTLWAMSQ